jgi:hypothetical protein
MYLHLFVTLSEESECVYDTIYDVMALVYCQ